MFSSLNASCNKYVVALVDILGAKEMIMSQNQNNCLKDIHFIYDFTDRIQNIDRDFIIKIYSDNIIIAHIIENEKEQIEIMKMLNNMFLFVADFQWHLLNLGYLSRGAITISDFYIDNILVWGKALVRVHEMESKISIYPRVIVDEEIMKIYKGEKLLLIQDKDRHYFIDYLSKNLDCELEKFPYTLEMITKESEKIKDEHIKEKYEWYIDYHKRIYDNYDIKAWEKRWEGIWAEFLNKDKL